MSTSPSKETPAEAVFNPSERETVSPLREQGYFLLKRRWLFLLVWTTVLGSTILYTRLQAPEYEATALMEISRARLKILQDVIVEDASESQFYGSQKAVLRSRTLAERVVRKLALWRHPQFKMGASSEDPPTNLQPLADGVRSMLLVSLIEGTQVMQVSFSTKDPALSAELANTLANEYVAFSSMTATATARNTASFIDDQVKRLQEDVREKEKLLEGYSRKLDILPGEKVATRQVDSLNAQLTEAQVQKSTAEARYKSLKSADPSSLPEVVENRAIADLKQQYLAQKRQQAELEARFKPGWPALQQVERTLEDVTRRMDEETRTVVTNVIARARVQYEMAAQRESLLRRTLNKEKEAVQRLNAQSVEYDRIKMELDSQRVVIQELLRQQSEAGLSAELGERAPVNVRVIEEAATPDGPARPDLRKNAMMAAIAGLCLALGVVASLKYLDSSIYTPLDLRRYASLPYLGMVPRLGGDHGKAQDAGPSDKEEKGSPQILAALRTHAPATGAAHSEHASRGQTLLAERMKFLRSALLHPPRGASPKTLLVTSPDEHAGKTFVSSNLAASLAARGKRVLLIDTDVRIPMLHRVFSVENDWGLTTVLREAAPLGPWNIPVTEFENLYLLPAGPKTDSPAELLDSPAMDEALRRLADEFEIVLLDSAPLLPVADTIPLTRKCDAVLLVVRSGATQGHAVKASVDVVDRVGGRLSGVVLNDVNLRDPADLFYHSRYTYEYGTYSREKGP